MTFRSGLNNRKHRIIYTYSHIFGNIEKISLPSLSRLVGTAGRFDIFKLLFSKNIKINIKTDKIRLLFSMF